MAAVRPAVVTAIGIGGLWGGLAGVRVLETGAAAPGPAVWIAIVGLGALSSGSICLPVAAAAGVVASLAGMVDDGSWTGLQASGVSGRRLAPIAAAMGLFTGLATFGMAGYGEPIARRSAGRALATAVDVRLSPGGLVTLGRLALRADRVDVHGASDVFFAIDGAIGTARHATIDRGTGGARVSLTDGAVAGLDPRPWRVEFREWHRDLPGLAQPRVELDERTNPELADAVARTAAAGRDARYERAVLWKRWLHPLAAAVFPVAAMPLGASARPYAALAAVAVGYLVAVRAGDQLAMALGPTAAGAGPAWLAGCGIVAWAAWRER